MFLCSRSAGPSCSRTVLGSCKPGPSTTRILLGGTGTRRKISIRRKERIKERRRTVLVPDFSTIGRKRSILLDDPSPILNPERFTPTRWTDDAFDGIQLPDELLKDGKRPDIPALLHEREFDKDPFLKMLGTPLRRELVTSTILPTDLMIRLRLARPSDEERSLYWYPEPADPVERAKATKSGTSFYVACWRPLVELFIDRHTKRPGWPIPDNVRAHPLLADQIADELQLAVLHELAVLRANLPHHPRPEAYKPVLRRLTRDELKALKDGTADLPGAAAVLMATKENPGNRNRPRAPSSHPNANWKNWDAAAAAAASAAAGRQGEETRRKRLTAASEVVFASPDIGLPRRPVPIYNSVVLFPDAGRRKQLMGVIKEILTAERRAKMKARELMGAPKRQKVRMSHGYLISLDEKTLRRWNTGPLLIALWRMRLWHGEGWQKPGEKPPSIQEGEVTGQAAEEPAETTEQQEEDEDEEEDDEE